MKNPLKVYRIGKLNLWIVAGELNGDTVWFGPYYTQKDAETAKHDRFLCLEEEILENG